MKKLLLILSACAVVHAYAQNNDPGSFSDYKAKQIETIKKEIEKQGGLEEIPSPVRKPSGLRTAAAPQTISNRITIGCQDLFINGTNIAWVRFAMDVGEDPDNGTQLRPNMTKFESVFDLAQASGMNTIRWWLHVNGSHSPSFDNNNARVSALEDLFDTCTVLTAIGSENL